MEKGKRWSVREPDPVLQRILAKGLNISPLTAQLLINRGIYSVQAARKFLNISIEELHPPELIRDLPKAAEIISASIDRGDKIYVYGDYDVDGIAGTVLLVDVLRRLGNNAAYYIPHRINEGYGLNREALSKLKENAADLVITVDCGISSWAEVEYSYAKGGPAIIITDHHEPPERLPDAAAIVNPKRQDCPYPFSELAGVGVAFKLAQALLDLKGRPFSAEEYLDLVCLGTIADIVPMQGENRILAIQGLLSLNKQARQGLKALIECSGIKKGAITSWDVGFLLAPRINAAGRVGSADVVIEMLLTDSYQKAFPLAQQLDRANKERQNLEANVLAEALAMLESQPELAQKNVLVLASHDWHPGVIGIVASRLVDRFHKPALLIACSEDQGKGSARSVSGFNIYNAFSHCANVLKGFGGHAMAGGFSLDTDQIDALRNSINDYAAEHLLPTDAKPIIEVDALVSLQDITYQLIDEIAQLAPHGHGNPDPLFALRQAELINYREVGKNNAHLKMRLKEDSVFIDGIGFNLGCLSEELAAAKDISVAFTPEVNIWQGKQSLQAKVLDIHPEPLRDTLGDKHADNIQDRGLLTAGDLATVPDTISAGLKAYLLKRGYTTPPEMAYLTSCDFEDKILTPETAFRLAEIKYGVGTREKRLAFLEPTMLCTLLLTDSPDHTLQISRYIENHNLKFSETATYLHSYLEEEQLLHRCSLINSGQIKLVVATAAILNKISTNFLTDIFDQVLLTHPLVRIGSKQLFQNLSITCVEELYLPEDAEENRSHLEELAPERDFLVHFFALLRSLAPSGDGAYSMTHLTERMRQGGYPTKSFIPLIVGLAVFADLDLLHFYWEQDMLKYILHPINGRKTNLSESPTFNWTHNIKSHGLQMVSLN